MNEKLELQLQRLADGELNRRQISALLQQAQSQPELWESMALAFVENQVLQREIAAGQDEAVWTRTARRAEHKSPASQRPPSWRWWSALAATWLLMPLAYWTGSLNSASSFGPSPQVAVNEVQQHDSKQDPGLLAQNDGQSPSREPNPPLYSAPYRMNLVSRDGTRLVENPVPIYPDALYDVSGLSEVPTTPISLDARQKLHRWGLQVRPQTTLIEVRLEDGREIVVPIHSYTVTPYGQ